MNYEKIYFSIINNRKINKLDKSKCKCEVHHIIPRSLGGSNEKENLVNLTLREHFICHKLLIKIYYSKNDIISYKKMLLSFKYMSSIPRYNINVNSRFFEFYKTEWSKVRIEINRSYKNKVFYVFNPNTLQTKRIFKWQLDDFLKDGWVHSQNPSFVKSKSKTECGNKNPAFGKKWIKNPNTGESLYINKNDVKIYLDNGWIYGMSDETIKKHKNRKRKPHTELTKNKIGNGTRNTVWIYNEQLNKHLRIKKEDLNKYLNLGWIKGYRHLK